MESFIKDQIIATLKILPAHLLSSYFKKLGSPQADLARRKVGGFIKGVCHPTENYGQIKGAGIRWNRADIPFPFDKEGTITQNYLNWKEKIRGYVNNGIRIMAVTPYPDEYIQAGVDPRSPNNEARVREIAVFLIKDLHNLIGALQVTNEMGIPRFILPLTMKEAVRFIGIQLEAMYPHRGNILIGYNSAGPQADLHQQMKVWHKYCDYVGIDIYIGCFIPVGNRLFMFDLLLRYLWSYVGKPIILTEFGYISDGTPKTPAEKTAILQRYGVSSEAEARKDIQSFVAKLNPTMQEQVHHNASSDWGDFLFQLDFCNHLYCELPKHTVIQKYPHSPQGQADFYRALYPRLVRYPFLIGAFVYCYADSEKCYVCGQPDCPTETRWGLTTIDGKEKPSYYAVRDALEKIK